MQHVLCVDILGQRVRMAVNPPVSATFLQVSAKHPAPVELEFEKAPQFLGVFRAGAPHPQKPTTIDTSPMLLFSFFSWANPCPTSWPEKARVIELTEVYMPCLCLTKKRYGGLAYAGLPKKRSRAGRRTRRWSWL